MRRYALAILFGSTPSANAAGAGADLATRAARLDLARPMNTLGCSVIVANTGPDQAQHAEL